MCLCSTDIPNFEYFYWIINRHERFGVGKDFAHGRIWTFIDYIYSSNACVKVFLVSMHSKIYTWLSIKSRTFNLQLIAHNYSFPNIGMRKLDTKDRGSGYCWPRVCVDYKTQSTDICFTSSLSVNVHGSFIISFLTPAIVYKNMIL